ncbi:MAG: glycoside hydrolase family 16 protein, partial [Mycobacterium sp.]|nr:glycoside hydrolase family 16 protein [Mycobacterium sp.]
PGQTSQGIALQLYRLDHKPLDQANDRSFNAAVAQYTPSKLVTAYVEGVLDWGEEPSSQEPLPAASTGPAVVPSTGIAFDNFHYTGYDDPALAANGWGGRSGKGGPGIPDTWSTDGITFPADDTAQGGQTLQLQLSSDGTKQGTHQSELVGTRNTFRTGTLAARVYFTDKPVDGPNGDHINETFAPISPSAASANYSELDYEYMPNGGWGAPGPRLDTTSWRSSKQGDRATSHQNNHLAGWHILMITAIDGTVTYSVDGQTVFTSNGKTFPREQMQIHFSTWLVDLPFTGQRTWSMRVNWVFQASGAMSVTDVQKAVDALYASGIDHVNTVVG